MLLPHLVDLLFIVVQISFFICIALCTTDDLEQHVIISLHHSIDGVNHLITFEANHLLSACPNRPLTSPDLRTSPRGLVFRRDDTLFPETPAGSSSSSRRSRLPTLFVAAHFHRLTFFSRGGNE